MRAIQLSQYGGPEVLHLVDLPDPVPAPGEVLVDIRAASVNAADWKGRRGTSLHGTGLPHVLGRDFSGVVSAVGPGADFSVGDEVFAVCPNTMERAYAERIVIPAEFVTFKPARLSHLEAAAMALTGLTAMVALQDTLDVQKGEKVLIQGGAGGVGTMAVQIARYLGAEVGATARAENHDYLRAYGATTCIDYRTQSIPEVFGNCDAVFDCVGPATAETTLAALGPNGRAAFIGMGNAPPLPPQPGQRSLKPDVFRSRERIERVAALIEQVPLRPPEIHAMPLSEAVEAHRLSEAGHVRGKIVFDLS